MDVMAKINEAIKLLNSIDEYGSTLVSKLSDLDSKEQDILHYIENNKISVLWCYNVIRKLKDIRIERRKVKNDMELMSKYNDLKNRLSSKDNREFILSQLHVKEKQLNTTYKNRKYSEDDIRNILKGIDTDDRNKPEVQNKKGS
jgi:hypothetical protein